MSAISTKDTMVNDKIRQRKETFSDGVVGSLYSGCSRYTTQLCPVQFVSYQQYQLHNYQKSVNTQYPSQN